MPFNMSDECSPPREKVQFYEPSSKEREFRVQNLLLCSGEKPALAVSPGPNVGQHGGIRNSGRGLWTFCPTGPLLRQAALRALREDTCSSGFLLS